MRTILMAALVLVLAGCQANPIVQHEVVRVPIPATLLVPCPGYAGIPKTNGELAEAYAQERYGREQCNRDKEAIKSLQ